MSASAATWSAACSGVTPAHGASSSHDRRSPTIRSGPTAARTASSTSRVSAQAVLAVGVVALVGEPGVELAQDRQRAGVDLHPVEAGPDGRPGRRGEALDQCLDLGGAHGHRHLAADHVGHRGRRPQHRLRVGARPLAAGVAESGQHHGAVGWQASATACQPGPQAEASGARS